MWSRGAQLNMQRLTNSCLLRCVSVNVGCVFVLGDVFHDDEVFVNVL